MRPYLTACQHWSQPEKPAPNTQPHPGIQDPNNGDKVWARISSALGEAMWDDGTSDANLDGLSLGDLDDLGMIKMTLDGQNLSPFQDTPNISMRK
jgi:hypothetical protein